MGITVTATLAGGGAFSAATLAADAEAAGTEATTEAAAQDGEAEASGTITVRLKGIGSAACTMVDGSVVEAKDGELATCGQNIDIMRLTAEAGTFDTAPEITVTKNGEKVEDISGIVINQGGAGANYVIDLKNGFDMSDAAYSIEVAASGYSAEEETEAQTEAETEAETETETETEEAETEEIDIASLADFNYEKGTMDDDGWESAFLGMEYKPGKGISMDADENDQLDTYYSRNGEDSQVAYNEMVAMDEDGGYVQLMAEVNPNHEEAPDILGRFTEQEGLLLVSKTDKKDIAGKEFLTCTGVIEKERYLLGVSTDSKDIVLALKVKYEDSAARTALLEGFKATEDADAEAEADAAAGTAETVAETEAAETEEAGTEAAETESQLSLPDDFKDAEVITEAETEGDLEINLDAIG